MNRRQKTAGGTVEGEASILPGCALAESCQPLHRAVDGNPPIRLSRDQPRQQHIPAKQTPSVSHNGTTGSDSQLVGYAAIGVLHIAEPHTKEPVMSNVRFIGLDVHAETIAVAVAEKDGRCVRWGDSQPIGVDPEARKKLGAGGKLRVCYEAGPTGYGLYWQLTALGIQCEVVAPTLVPVKAGDRVKTDRRDALKLARSYRAGDLTSVWVPDAEHEALRDLVRAREAAKKDQLRARHRLGKFLLRHGGVRTPDERVDAGAPDMGGDSAFGHAAQEVTLLDYLHEVEHVADRIEAARAGD